MKDLLMPNFIKLKMISATQYSCLTSATNFVTFRAAESVPLYLFDKFSKDLRFVELFIAEAASSFPPRMYLKFRCMKNFATNFKGLVYIFTHINSVCMNRLLISSKFLKFSNFKYFLYEETYI